METFVTSVQESGWTLERLRWRLANTLQNTDWQGKDVLEIGCGAGDFSLYMALNGARYVTGIDPESAGASHSSLTLLDHRLQQMDVPNFAFHPLTFEAYNPEPASVDLIFLVNVIEHIHETLLPLDRDAAARSDYAAFFARAYATLRPGGTLVVANCSRVGLWALVSRATGYRLRTPFPSMRKVQWELHQTPQTWAALMHEAGFRGLSIGWRVPFVLRNFPWVADNPLFAFLTFSDYSVRGIKSSISAD